MLHAVDGLVFETPFGFQRESTTVSLRAPPEKTGAEADLRPNLVVHRRPAGQAASLADCVAEATKELAESVPGIGRVEAADLRFDDGARGTALAYSFASAVRPGVTVAQLQALRLDGATVTSLTLTTAAKLLTEPRRGEYLKALASARPSGSP